MFRIVPDILSRFLIVNTDYFHIGNIPGKLYVAEQTVYIEDPDNPGSWIISTQDAYTEHIPNSLRNARFIKVTPELKYESC